MFMQLWAKPSIYKGINEVYFMYILIDYITPYE